MVANYQKAGPATLPGEVSHRIAAPWSRNKADDYGKWYISGNVVEGNSRVSENNWLGGVQPKDGSSYIKGLKLNDPWPAMPIIQETPEKAYASVLEDAGVVLPKRDAVDLRIIDEVKNGYASFEGSTYETHHKVADPSKKCGIIDSQEDVGGWPELESLPAPKDSDHDGMPDSWEDKNNLDKINPDDGSKKASD